MTCVFGLFIIIDYMHVINYQSSLLFHGLREKLDMLVITNKIILKKNDCGGTITISR